MNKPSGNSTLPAGIKLNSFNRKFRIKSRQDFSFIYQNGRRISAAYYNAYFIKSGSIRLGISIPKKLGNSVFRNRQKRIIREFFRIEKNNIFCDYDIVIVLKKFPVDLLAQKKDLQRIFQCLPSISR